jgi:branched-chain amino acid transport system ATP-binding protein
MTLLDVEGLSTFYGDLQALFGIDLAVEAGQTVALIGANGAGKTTFLKSVAGLIAGTRGTIRLDGEPIERLGAERISRLGVALVPEGRLLFNTLSIEENLLMGAYNRRPGHWDLARVYELFPILGERRKMAPGLLSGGQQQMVAIARALMANPRLLLAHEISQGHAPVVVDQIYRAFPAISAEGTSIVIVEQEVKRASSAADYVYCLLKGRITLQGRAADLSFERLSQAYFGT